MTIATITMTALPASVPADGVTTITCEATVLDSSIPAVLVEGAAVNWTSADANVVFTPSSSVTNAQGIASTLATSTVADSAAVLTATSADVVTATANATVTFTAVASNFVIDAIDIDPMVAEPGIDEVVSVKIMDISGAIAPAGTSVNWTATDASALSLTSSVTDAEGVASVTVNAAYNGVIEVTATVGTSSKNVLARYSDDAIRPVFVPNGADGELDQYDLSYGVQVVIDAYNHAAVGDILTFFWDDVHHYTREILDLETDFPISLDISNTFPPTCLADGDYSLFYEYLDSAKNVNVSLPWEILVTGGQLPATLTEPTFPEGNDGWINLNEANSFDGTPVQMVWAGMDAGDQVQVIWQGYDLNGISIPDASADLNITVTSADLDAGYCSVVIPTEAIMPIIKGSAQAYYQVTPASGESVQLSVAAIVKVDVQP